MLWLPQKTSLGGCDMSRAIQLTDGSYKFINKGIPPDPDLFPGFEVNPQDQYHLIPVYPACKFRSNGKFRMPYGKYAPICICKLKNNIPVGAPFCKECKEQERAPLETSVDFMIYPLEFKDEHSTNVDRINNS